MTAQGTGETSGDDTLENLGPHLTDQSGDVPSWAAREPAATDPRPPWELGDRS